MSTQGGSLDVSGDGVPDRRIAYVKVNPKENKARRPTVVFLHGLFSSMAGGKAIMLEELALKLDFPFVRFDFTACGESSGDPSEVSMTVWKNDALAVIDKLTEGPVVVVGSSLGGWLMLLVALERLHRIQGLVGVASAPDFLIKRIDNLSAEAKAYFERYGSLKYPDPKEGPYTITKHMYDDALQHRVLVGDALRDVTCKVRLIHGQRDDAVPWNVSLELSDRLTGCNDIDIVLRKNGEHRMSLNEDLELIKRTVVEAFLYPSS